MSSSSNSWPSVRSRRHIGPGNLTGAPDASAVRAPPSRRDRRRNRPGAGPSPLGRQQAVDDPVDAPGPDEPPPPQDPLLREAEPLGDRPAARVLRRGLDDDAVQA